MADTNQPPFMPPAFTQLTGSQLGGGGATPYSGPMEDGPGTFANPANSANAVRYTGQSQTAFINWAFVKGPRQDWPHAAPPSISKIP